MSLSQENAAGAGERSAALVNHYTANDSRHPGGDQDFDAIPTDLAERRQWLVWRAESHPGDKKSRKVPYYANGKRRTGAQGSDADRAELADLATARTAMVKGKYSGVGMALLPGDGLIGVDLDNMINVETGEIAKRCGEIIAACNSYTEYSPSGRGVHIICSGTTDTFKSNEIGVEVFCGRQFFTFTGRRYAGTPATINPIGGKVLRRLRATVDSAKRRDDGKPAAAPAVGGDLRAKVESALAFVSADVGYDDWIKLGMAIHAELGDAGLEVWDAWSSRSTKYPGAAELRTHWRSFRDGGVTGATLYGLASAAGWRAPRPVGTTTPPASRSSHLGNPGGADSEPAVPADEGPHPLTPPTMDPAGFPPLVAEIVEAACANSEAHPVAVAANMIAWFCCLIGRVLYQLIGDAAIHCRPFVLIVGKSGKARKGTAEHTVRLIFKRVDELLREELDNDDRLRVHAGGVSTGEGIAWAIRDPREPDENGKGGDPGVHDKRLLVVESEFDNLLSQLRRENNTLSATVRNLFDGRDMEPLTKTSQTRATRPHVVIVGHVTGHELREKSTENDAANGLMNRFLMLYVYRPKLVPLPEPTPRQVIDLLAGKIAAAVHKITGGNLHGHNEVDAQLSQEARELWVTEYPRLTRDRDGKGGSLLARSEVYARMLAMIFAAMDGRTVIEPQDLRAAVAWIEYWHASVTYVFNTPDDADELDEFTTAVLDVITKNPGITLTGLQEHWNRKRIKDVRAAVERLSNLAPPLIQAVKDQQTGGRSAMKFNAYRNR